MATLGPQIVSQSYGNLLKFLPTGEDGVTTNQVQITDGKGKVTPLYLATGSVRVDSEFTASADVVFSGLTQATQTNIVCIDGSGRLYFQNSASFQDNDWTVGSSYMTASGQDNVYIPNSLENGLTNNAQGAYSHAEGANTIAIGDYSHAEGRLVSANGTWSHAEGSLTKTIANYAHAEGSSSLAEGIASHAEGYITSASSLYAHAEGQNTKAIGVASHAEGVNTRAEGLFSHAEGANTIAIGDYSHAEGRLVSASGNWSHAEGANTITIGDYSHAEGLITEAVGNYSHAEGAGTRAEGFFSHAEGANTIAIGNASHAEGFQVSASGNWSHAEGNKTLAIGNYSHAGGSHTTASGEGSHAGGFETNAILDHQTVVGRRNAISYGFDDTFVVGNGQRSDAFKVRTDTSEVIISPIIRNLVNNTNVYGTTPNAFPGLYFGEPQNENTIRIIRGEAYDPTSILINPPSVNSLIIQENQSNNGSNYTNEMAIFASTVTFVAD